jgi:signal transduction histidine kinase
MQLAELSNELLLDISDLGVGFDSKRQSKAEV